MRIARKNLFAVLGLGTLAWGLMAFAGLQAQPAPGVTQRDCQTIRTCNYARNGTYRGCLSAYSCRVCKFVRTNCTIDGTRKTCQEMKCGWG